MILFPHMLVGAAIGYKIKNYWVILGIAFILHFLFDRIPHWEYTGQLKIKNVSPKELSSLFFKALIDLGVGVFLIWVFLRGSAYWPYILWGAFVSILPDGIVFLHLLARVVNREIPVLKIFHAFHENIHVPDDENHAVWGFATQSLIIFLSIYLIWACR